jgi:hypothetical protein
MKRKLNERLSLQSLIVISSFSLLLILLSASIARACGPAQTKGSDINCTVQVINDCAEPNSCVLRTCHYAVLGHGGQCNKHDLPCGGCVFTPRGCSGLIECCLGRSNCS